jgi:hypothetical protein
LLFYVTVALPAIAAGLELGRQSDDDSTYINPSHNPRVRFDSNQNPIDPL